MVTSTLKLPQHSATEQKQGKASWNEEHGVPEPDFYTLGYSGRNIADLIEVLKVAGVATLVDIRYTPLSRFKPEFSKNNLKRVLEASGIEYVHRPDWGVPREIRACCVGKETRDDIWSWYDSHVLPTVVKKNLDEFFNSMEHPIGLLCVEHDPKECHRHRIFLALERLGLRGCDL